MRMNAAGMMTLATGMTLARIVAVPRRPDTHAVSRVILGGVFATAGLLALEQSRPREARGLAAVIVTTAALTHGYALASKLTTLVAPPTTPPAKETPPP